MKRYLKRFLNWYSNLKGLDIPKDELSKDTMMYYRELPKESTFAKDVIETIGGAFKWKE